MFKMSNHSQDLIRFFCNLSICIANKFPQATIILCFILNLPNKAKESFKVPNAVSLSFFSSSAVSRSRLNYCGESSWRMLCLEVLGDFEREEILLLAYPSARCEVRRKSRRGIRLERNIARDFTNVSRFVNVTNNFEILMYITIIYQRC